MDRTLMPQRGLSSLRPYVPGKPIDEVRREYGLTDIIKLASNENPLGPSPKAMEAMHEAIARLHIYPDGQSYTLRQALAQHYALPMEQIAVGNGADSLILRFCMAYVDEGSEVIVSRSSFPVYDLYTHLMRGQLIKTPLRDGFRLDLAAMAEAITERTRLVFVCNPNNPTGTIVTRQEVDAFLRRLPDHVLVIFDEAYHEFVDDPAYPDTMRHIRYRRENIAILRTYSKVYGLAGVRLGYAFAAPSVIATIRRVKPPFDVNVLAQAAGIAALEDAEHVRRTVELIRRERHALYRAFERLGLRYVESQTNFILVEIGPHAQEAAEALLRRGIIVRPCGGYDLPHHLRISVGLPEQNARLIRALEAVLPSLAQAS